MKWKTVTRQTRFLGALALLSAVGSVWAFATAQQNNCVNHVEVAPAPAHIVRAAFDPSSQPHLLLAQDDDTPTDPSENVVGSARSGDFGTMVQSGRSEDHPAVIHATPCIPPSGVIGHLRETFLVSFLIFTLATAYSLRRDKIRYAKRLRSRIQREDIRRRRGSSDLMRVPPPPIDVRQPLIGICACGCNEVTKAGHEFVPGHAQLLRLDLERQVGGLLALRQLVEEHGPKES